MARTAVAPASNRIGALSFAALMLGHSAQGLTFTAFTPALAGIARDFSVGGHGQLVAQMTLTMASAGLIVGAFLSGWVVERLGARVTLLVSIVAFGVFGAGGLFLHDVVELLTSRMVVGFCAACLVTAAVAEIAARFEGNARAKLIGASTGLGSATALIALLLGGVLAQTGGWRLAFIQYPVFAALGLVAVLLGLPGNSKVSVTPPQGSAGGLARLAPMYLLSLVIMMVMFLGSTQFAFLLPQDGVRSPTMISLIMALTTLFAVGASFAYGWIEGHLRAQGALALGLAANAIGLALIGLVPNAAAAGVGAALMGVYVGLVMPYTHHSVASLAPAHARARAIGFLNAFNFIGAFINPFLFNPVSTRFGLHGLFLIVGCGMGVMAMAALGLRIRAAAPMTRPVLAH